MSRMPYRKYLKYPHLRPEDAKIWDEFMASNPTFFKEVEYDVKVGEGRDYSNYPEGPIKQDMELLSKKRIDVIGFTDEEIYVIEIKPKAEMKAIGQALSLADLYADIALRDKVILPTIITDEEIPDTANLCEKLGIVYILSS